MNIHQRFSRITALLTFILKTSGSTESTTQPGKGVVEAGDDSRARRDQNKLDKSEMDDNEVDGGKIDNEIEKKSQKTFKFKNLFKFKKLSESKKILRLDFFILRARLAFIKLRHEFVKALILYPFDLECHIRFETDISGYAIGGILSQLTLDDLGQWHPVVFFSLQIIPAETRYETHNGELLAILEAFKTSKHYLEDSQH